jgi:hypothetical protein
LVHRLVLDVGHVRLGVLVPPVLAVGAADPERPCPAGKPCIAAKFSRLT